MELYREEYGALSHYVLVDSTGCNPGWLWEISGNGLLQKSYLFGTCHGEGHNFTDTLSMRGAGQEPL